MITIKGQLQWNDYLQVELLHSPLKTGLTSLIFLPLAFIFFWGVFWTITWQLLAVMMGLLVVLLSYLMLNHFILLPQKVRNVFQQQKNLSMPFEYEITAAGLTKKSELGNQRIPWDSYTHWTENKDLFILYYSDALVEVIPKRLISEQNQVTIIRDYLKSQVPAALRARKFSLKDSLPPVIMIIFLLWMLYRDLLSK